jgi:hypothetical protein
MIKWFEPLKKSLKRGWFQGFTSRDFALYTHRRFWDRFLVGAERWHSNLMECHAMSGRESPELIVKFWPPSVRAKGVPAINAIRRPLAFAIYARPVIAIATVLTVVWGGKSYAISALNYLKSFFWVACTAAGWPKRLPHRVRDKRSGPCIPVSIRPSGLPEKTIAKI